jgi:hypothetical protein
MKFNIKKRVITSSRLIHVCSIKALAELPTPQEKIEKKDLQQNGEMKKYMQVSTTVPYVFLLTTLSINIIKVFHIIHNPLLDLVLVLDLFLPLPLPVPVVCL